ncbi:hypothetical protein EON65_21285 [archaeon]|nr:MAG: hypothetical protein EON65_21285 [archaeon]
MHIEFASILALSVLFLSLALPSFKARDRRDFSLSILTKHLTAMTIIGGIRFWNGIAGQQFETASDIPDSFFKGKKIIHTVVEKIVDGDTVRVRHKSCTRARSYEGPMKDHTIMVRIAAVDTPETAKRGEKGQPFAEEARLFTEKQLKNKEVDVKLLSKDKYGRVIGRISYKSTYFFGMVSIKRDISEELLKQGLAVVYRQGGAQYDGGVAQWNALEQRAIQQKKGMWKNGKDKVETPAQYKRKAKEPVMAGAKANYL